MLTRLGDVVNRRIPAGPARSYWTAALFILAGSALFLAPELLGLRRLGGGTLDVWTTPVWTYVHDRWVTRGGLPRWNPYLFCGLPLLGHPACGLYYPPNWFLWLFSAARAVPLCAWLHACIAAAGAGFLLLRLGCRWGVAAVGGLALAVGGVLPAILAHPEQVEVWAWWPWLVLCMQDDRVLLAGLVVALQGLAGDPQGVLVSGVSATLFLMAQRAQDDDAFGVLASALGVSALGLGVAAVQWLPYAALYRHSLRYHGPVGHPLQAGAADMLALLWPGADGGRFFVLIPVTAVVLGVLAFRNRPALRRSVVGAWLATVLATGMAWGFAGPGGAIGRWLLRQGQPGLDLPRTLRQTIFDLAGHGWNALLGDEPWRWLIAVGLLLGLLAALGVEALVARDRRSGSVALGVHLAVAVVIGRLALPQAPPPAPLPARASGAIEALSGSGMRYILAGQVDPRLYNFGCVVWSEDACGLSAMVPIDTCDVLNFAAFHRIVDPRDRDVLLTNMHRIDSNGFDDSVLRWLAVDTVIDQPAADAPIHVRHVTGAVPRVRVVNRYDTFEREQDPDTLPADPTLEAPSPELLSHVLLEHMATPRSVPSDAVLLDQTPDLGGPVLHGSRLEWQAKIVPDTSEQFIVNVHASHKGLLVLADAYDEGWRATVNGEPHRVYPADGIMRAVVVPAGDSTVEWRYEPPSWIAGRDVSLGTLLLIALLALRDKRRKVTTQPVVSG